MSKYRGTALVVQWINPAGTLTIQLPTTSFDVQREIDLIDTTSGSDLDHEYIVGNKKGTLTLKAYDDSVSGTAILSQLIEGTYGTIQWSPQGTATNSPKQSCAAYIKSLKHNMPYDKGLDYETAFEKNGPMLSDFGSHW